MNSRVGQNKLQVTEKEDETKEYSLQKPGHRTPASAVGVAGQVQRGGGLVCFVLFCFGIYGPFSSNIS